MATGISAVENSTVLGELRREKERGVTIMVFLYLRLAGLSLLSGRMPEDVKAAKALLNALFCEMDTTYLMFGVLCV